MIAELGHYALILCLLMALVQGTLPLIGAGRGDHQWMALAGPAVLAQFVFASFAFGALIYAYVVSDFSVANVVQNSHSAKPLLYKFTGAWGNHEGSLLLWIWILALYGALVALFGTNLPATLKARVLAVQGLIGVGFLTFSLATSNPFLRLDPAPLNGNDLNPLLQDPGLAFHPPLLYFGYVGFSMTFAFAVAGLLEGRVDAAWARWVRPWALLAWSSLTGGVALGSWWAYYELGWGGYWFWDPVENASFMPWLLGTALLHSAIVCEKRGALKTWTVLLAILTFSLSLIGTFLVRSGVLTSVHAFATDPTRGVFILGFLVIVIGGSLGLYAWRAPSLKAGGLFQPVSREGSLLLNNLLLAVACGTVFVGTLYPLILDVMGGGKVSVGPPFFELTFVPIMVPLVLVVAVGPLLAWKRGELAAALARLGPAFLAAIAAGLVALALNDWKGGFAALGIGIAAWLFSGVVIELAFRLKLFRVPLLESLRRAMARPRAAYGMSLAHAGLALLVAGTVASGAWQGEAQQVMRPGDSVTVGGYEVTLREVESVNGPNYTAERARFEVARNGRFLAELYPERRRYRVGGRETTEAAIRTTWLADLYVVIGEPDGTGGFATRLYFNPLVPWIWIGAFVMVLGGGVSLSDRRHRVGVPERKAALVREAEASV
ncbi:MAG: heme lyase CcmF/NrfE family subunit [Alphaproteobacteria bacterium]